jgi:hypothetical protein
VNGVRAAIAIPHKDWNIVPRVGHRIGLEVRRRSVQPGAARAVGPIAVRRALWPLAWVTTHLRAGR